jgi:hypothetical protein
MQGSGLDDGLKVFAQPLRETDRLVEVDRPGPRISFHRRGAFANNNQSTGHSFMQLAHFA